MSAKPIPLCRDPKSIDATAAPQGARPCIAVLTGFDIPDFLWVACCTIYRSWHVTVVRFVGPEGRGGGAEARSRRRSLKPHRSGL